MRFRAIVTFAIAALLLSGCANESRYPMSGVSAGPADSVRGMSHHDFSAWSVP
ncbi:hypothetical protein ACFSUD_00860 [Sulfitobacter aestuarii]|uniref:Lipoprotein n=1 Tax=Sulfitobacter aestuarii TaxID=2161676 RepID=A0ABW5TXV2_9RHOB